MTDITKNGADDESLPLGQGDPPSQSVLKDVEDSLPLGQGDPPSQSTLIHDPLFDESGFSLSQSRRRRRKEKKKEKKEEKKPEKKW